MTSCDIQGSGAIELYFYGELGGEEHQELARHIRTCEACRRALEELAIIRDALSARPDISAPAGGDWGPFMARLDEAVGAERARRGVAAPPVLRNRSAAPPSYAGYLAMAALLALVTMSVLFVARTRDGATQPIDPASSGVTVRKPEPDPALATISEQHFERSKLVLLGLTTRDAGQSAGWEYERDLAAGLLNDTRLYRMAAETRGMSRLAGVLRDLELVLLQTSMTDESDPAALARIQRLIRKRDLLGQMETMTVAATGS